MHYNALVERYEKLQKKSLLLQKQKEERLGKRDLIGGFILEFSKCKELLTGLINNFGLQQSIKLLCFRMEEYCLLLRMERKSRYRIYLMKLGTLHCCRVLFLFIMI